VTLHFSHRDLTNGSDIIAPTQSQIKRLGKAHEAGKNVRITLPKKEIQHIMKVEGGILPLLAGLASQAVPFLTGTVLPALCVGALSVLVSSGVKKLVGDGLFLKKVVMSVR